MTDDVPPSAQVVVDWGDDVINALDDPGSYLNEIGALPPPIANVICVELLDWQVRNGGFHQYFYNSYGIGIAGAIKGLEAMDLVKWASIARSALQKFGDQFPEAREARIEIVGDMQSEKISFDAEDAAYYDLDMQEMYAVLDAYARMAMDARTN